MSVGGIVGKQNISTEILDWAVIDSPDRTLLVDGGLWRGGDELVVARRLQCLGFARRESRALNASGWAYQRG